ncbi:GNAT family N-acetyltransferase [Jiangella rhizosphaerae]|uniref:GNAT family N-acetyltransferase n=1 Tax=Jiangella rhizosphaerae TaxID=2293569 RepID=A0A418KL65_9ACTN|nr:GNAT family N-acetyltransferase [Jiangella rhizosphaerae]RIQ18272.1 GNAT family N-acetyltransferase [Jiangella rhizosphaerae]
MTHIEQATPRDLDAFLDVLSAASARLHARGIDQWPRRFAASKVLPDIEAGRAYVVRDGRPVVATTILSEVGDADFWTPAELADPAYYVSKIATVDGYTGLGSALLDWCGRQAARQGGELLRLDAWRTNPDLHAYYLARGFRHVRTVELPHRNSGALFERPARDTVTDAMRDYGLADPSPVEVTP